MDVSPIRLLPALLVAASMTACAVPAAEIEPCATYGEPAVVGTIDTPGLVELSGLAASRIHDDLLWAHNDSLNQPILYAIGGDGRDLGSLRVEGASYLDWEDMASFKLEGQSYLVIGDVGDNKALRPFVSLWFVKEPAMTAGRRIEEGRSARVEWGIHYRYEDGPRDCEALAIDEPGRRILLLSKRTDPPVFYELPLNGPGGGTESVQTARRLAETPGLGKPTALDISPAGDRVVVQTGRYSYMFGRDDGQGWKDVFSGGPQRIEMPRMSSIEAVTFDRHGRSVFVTREQRPNPLLRIDPATE
jgi:hypothetical protein